MNTPRHGRVLILVALLVSVSGAGCRKPERKQTFKGKTTSEWLDAAKDKDERTRSAAAQALASLAKDDDSAKIALRELLNDPSGRVVYESVAGLRELGDDPKILVPALIRMLQAPDAVFRTGAADELEKLGPAAAAPALPALRQAVKNEKDDTILMMLSRSLEKLDKK